MSVLMYQVLQMELPLSVGHMRTRLVEWGFGWFTRRESWNDFLLAAYCRDERDFVFGDTEIISSPYQINAILLQLEMKHGLDIRLRFERKILNLWTGSIL